MSTTPLVTKVSLYAEHWPFVFELLPSYGVFAPDQEDVARTVWQNVAGQITTYNPALQSPRSWITGFVRQSAANYSRGRPDSIADEPRVDVAASGLTPKQWSLLRRIKEMMPDEAVRETFLLRCRHRLTFEEIAAAAGVTQDQIEWKFQLALRAFRIRGNAIQ
jgi:DNA-directed RNA polymerase specialized sigma24 family protein